MQKKLCSINFSKFDRK